MNFTVVDSPLRGQLKLFYRYVEDPHGSDNDLHSVFADASETPATVVDKIQVVLLRNPRKAKYWLEKDGRELEAGKTLKGEWCRCRWREKGSRD